MNRVTPLLLLVGLTLVLGAGAARCGLTLFTAQTTNPGNTFTADTLGPPTGLTAAPGAPAPRIELNWTATVDTYASGYNILRSTTAGGPYTQIDQVNGQATTTYTDTTVTAGTTYFYVVRSFYENWESTNSNEASATP